LKCFIVNSLAAGFVHGSLYLKLLVPGIHRLMKIGPSYMCKKNPVSLKNRLGSAVEPQLTDETSFLG
jgi:hypothetical protein